MKRDQQTVISFDELYRKSLHDKLIDKSEYESVCVNFTRYSEETENESFLQK